MLAFMVSTGLMAQELTNAPAAPALGPTNEPAAAPVPALEAPAPEVTPKPAPKKAPAKKTSTVKKGTAKKSAPRTAELRTVPLIPGPATVGANNVNVRGQAKLRSEVVARLSKDQPVLVFEEIVLKNTGPDEPSAWARIRLPEGTNVWVNTQFIEATSKTVIPKVLNLRSGPGENYSVLGRLAKGDAVKEVATRGDWIQIEAPTNAYAFVAAQYLRQAGPTVPDIAAHTPAAPSNQVAAVTEPPTTTSAVAEPPVIASAPGSAPDVPAATPAAADTNIVATTTGSETPAGEVEMEPEPEEVLPPRIVQREGIVRGTGSIQAPTHFALVSTDTRRLINYLYSSSPLLDLTRFKGMRIIVTGEEYMDERWGNTPVIAIQKIDVQGE
jgi:SH3-like domain-containing protein